MTRRKGVTLVSGVTAFRQRLQRTFWKVMDESIDGIGRSVKVRVGRKVDMSYADSRIIQDIYYESFIPELRVPIYRKGEMEIIIGEKILKSELKSSEELRSSILV